eukprot:gnl/Chilomastix_caulleri/3033.p1 GENE.gnl/Chilomastix_caulleri/3033~~gnl/Chilomastix_caulleri/3033.p1  ORF type:complete len:149 (+),score=23.06 gnl/Chilomastix_caulleri/3033:124-570(+)
MTASWARAWRRPSESRETEIQQPCHNTTLQRAPQFAGTTRLNQGKNEAGRELSTSRASHLGRFSWEMPAQSSKAGWCDFKAPPNVAKGLGVLEEPGEGWARETELAFEKQLYIAARFTTQTIPRFSQRARVLWQQMKETEDANQKMPK